jgi:acetoacetyl-CoA synthetase
LFRDFLSNEDNLEIDFEQLPADHPVYIMYSSGTTGVPKCIVHGAAGTLIQHIKELKLHADVKREDTIFYFTTCGWMMWNWLVSSLTLGARLMLFDGSPFFPRPGALWQMAQDEKVTIFGTSAKYLAAVEKAGVRPKESYDLTPLKAILSTGSPLSIESFEYVYRDIKEELVLSSISGGTDIISCFALGNPIGAVYAGELQCRGLGMKVQAFDDEGKPVTEEKGELVCTAAAPSMPIYFWNDPDGRKYRSAYFEVWPEVWSHGDYIEITRHGGVIIYGRSDATLNPGGVRIGTAEIYRQVENIPEVLDSLVVGQDWDNDVRVILFVKLREGQELTEELLKRIKTMIRQNTTPRHVPGKIIAVNDIPYTISGKKVELAVRKVIHNQEVKNKDALANPEALDLYKNLPELAS